MRRPPAESFRRNKLLTIVGLLHLWLLLAALLSVLDARSILGISAWYKPMKFMASITVYV